ncbi:hypothetical protein SHIRM173S_01619 [Streptomyces hirsutus]
MRKSPTTAERREPRTEARALAHRTSPHDPELLGVWSRQRHNVCHWLRQSGSQAVRQSGSTDDLPHFQVLKPLSHAHAEQLAEAIDNCPRPTAVAESAAVGGPDRFR